MGRLFAAKCLASAERLFGYEWALSERSAGSSNRLRRRDRLPLARGTGGRPATIEEAEVGPPTDKQRPRESHR